MQQRSRRGRTLGIVAGITGVAALGPVAAAQATVTTYPSAQWAAYSTNNLLKGSATASAVVTVPTVSCGAVPAGQSEGQDSVAQIDSSTTASEVLAGVRHYCIGDQAVYETTFITAHQQTAVIAPAGVAVSPGQTVKLFVRVYGNSTTSIVKNLTTGQSASTTKPGTVTAPYPYVGIVALSSNGAGGVLESGSPLPGNPQLPGPLPATGENFSKAKIDGRTLEFYNSRNNLGLVQWDTSESGGTVLATPSAVTSGSAFSITEISGPDTAFAEPLSRVAPARRQAAG